MWQRLKANFSACLQEYPAHHQHPTNQRYHLIGMPLIGVGLVLPLWKLELWWLAILLFLTGATLLGLGHRAEGNKPALLTNLMHIVVGPVWYIKKILGLK